MNAIRALNSRMARELKHLRRLKTGFWVRGPSINGLDRLLQEFASPSLTRVHLTAARVTIPGRVINRDLAMRLSNPGWKSWKRPISSGNQTPGFPG